MKNNAVSLSWNCEIEVSKSINTQSFQAVLSEVSTVVLWQIYSNGVTVPGNEQDGNYSDRAIRTEEREEASDLLAFAMERMRICLWLS